MNSFSFCSSEKFFIFSFEKYFLDIEFYICGVLFHFFFIGVKLLYNVVLVSAVQWSESAIRIPISPSSWTSLPPFPLHLGHHRGPSWAPCAIQQVPTTYLFTHGSVFMSNLISQFTPPSPSPPCPHVRSQYLCLYPCPTNRFIFLDIEFYICGGFFLSIVWILWHAWVQILCYLSCFVFSELLRSVVWWPSLTLEGS